MSEERILNQASLGAASCSAGSATTFDLSSVIEAGNQVVISNKAGGLARITFHGDTPDGTIGNAQRRSLLIYLNGGNAKRTFERQAGVTSVKIHPFTDDWQTVGVTIEELA